MNTKTYTGSKQTKAKILALIAACNFAFAIPTETAYAKQQTNYRYKNGYVQKVRYIPGTTKTRIEKGLIAQMRADRLKKQAEANKKKKTSVAKSKKSTNNKNTAKKQIVVAQLPQSKNYDYER